MDLWIISIGAMVLFIGWIVYEIWAAPEVDENGVKLIKESKESKETKGKQLYLLMFKMIL